MVQFEGRLNSLLAFEKLSSMDNSFWMKILRTWANQPWATIQGKPGAMTSPKDDENLEHQNEDTRKASESNSESFKQKIVEDAAKINLDVSNIAYLDLKPWNVLGKLDVERLGICPNLFQVQSGFFSFCAAIDTSHLDQVGEWGVVLSKKSYRIIFFVRRPCLILTQMAQSVEHWDTSHSKHFAL
jgi:hypothetical protein